MHKHLLKYLLLFWVVLAWPAMAQSNPYVSVGFLSPSNGAVYTAPANVVVQVSAFTIDDGVYVSQLRITQGGTVLASVVGESLSYTFYGLGPGTYTVNTNARSNLNGTASASSTFTVVAAGDKPPTISLNAPTGQPFIGPASIGLSANASDPDGHVVRVDYYANGGHIGSSTAAPFAFTWGGAGPGSYQITGVATDNNGKTATSGAVATVVAQSVIRGSVDGMEQGADGIYYLRGWACSSGRVDPVDVHIYAGGAAGVGQVLAPLRADVPSEPAHAAACQSTGTRYQFRFALTDAIRQAHANALLYVHGISPAGAGNDLLSNSGVFRIPPPLQLARRYVYDAQQRLCKVIEPETGATVMGYDGAGNLAWSASGLSLPNTQSCDRAAAEASGRVVRRTYDARNRPSTLTFPDGRGNQSWAYTPDGLPAQITTQNGDGTPAVVNTYVYNKRRLLTGETLTQQGVLDLSLGQGYNSNGHLAVQTFPQGLQVTYAPNALGQPSQAGTFATGVQYYPNGAVKQFVYGNGIVHQMQQNARLLPSRSTDTGTLDLQTSFDTNGNVTAINDLVRGSGHNRQMQYDAQDRLTAAYSPAFGGDGWYRFGYDALDNLRTWTQPGEGQRRYDYDGSNRLTVVRNAGGAAIIGLGYDVQGNLSIKNGQGYQFDFGNRLRVATSLERYRYDGHGRRSSVIDAGSGKNRHYLYSQGGALAYLWDQGTGERTQYIQLEGSLVAARKVAGSGAVSVRYQHTDALGSPVAETNEQAAVVLRTAYTPYGASIGAAQDGVGYTGHVMDGSTGLTYMQQRYMDPTVGMFLSVDPVTANEQPLGQFHRYRYGNGNPYKFKDPDGRVIETAWDVLNIAMGVDSAYGNFNQGNIGAGILDTIGVALDVTAAAVPFVPGGAGTAIKAVRGGEAAVNALRRTDKVEGGSAAVRAGNNGVEGPARLESRLSRSGEPAGKITYPDGSVKDVSGARVKEFVPQRHPSAPEGAMQRVKFEDAQPGSKGYKRDPTEQDLKDAGIK